MEDVGRDIAKKTVRDAARVITRNSFKNAKAEDPPSDTRREQGAPEAELPNLDSHQNKFAEAIDASMAGEETLQTVTKSAETGEVPEANELKDHMVKHDTKVLETQWVSLYGDDTTEEMPKRSCQGQGGVTAMELPRGAAKTRETTPLRGCQRGAAQEKLPRPGRSHGPGAAQEEPLRRQHHRGAAQEELPRPGRSHCNGAAKWELQRPRNPRGVAKLPRHEV